MSYNSSITIFIASILFIVNAGYAQDTLAKKYPAAVLVQLRSEHNRIAALTKDRMYKELAEVKKDGQQVRERMILDFKNNFTYCPVYYYIDTNADLIKQKIFDGILLNGDGSPATNLAINSNSDDYVVAYFGHPVSQAKTTEVQTDSSINNYDPQSPAGIGLVIMNDKFQQLTYFYKLGYDNAVFGGHNNVNKYSYNSKRFDIEYYPFAGVFNRKLLKKPGGHRVQGKPSDYK